MTAVAAAVGCRAISTVSTRSIEDLFQVSTQAGLPLAHAGSASCTPPMIGAFQALKTVPV
jgi:hypothetical protein